MIKPLTTACSISTYLAGCKEQEDQHLLGQTKVWITFFQLLQVGQTLYLLGEALKVTRGMEKVPYLIGWSAYLLPIAASTALHLTTPPEENPEHLRTARHHLFKVHRNVGNLCQLTSFISAITLARFGRKVEGIATATLLTVSLGERKQLFPDSLNQVRGYFWRGVGLLGIAGVLTRGNWGERILLATILAVKFTKNNDPWNEFRLFQGQARMALQRRFGPGDGKSLYLDRRHLDLSLVADLPPQPDVEIAALRDYESDIDKATDEELDIQFLHSDQAWSAEERGRKTAHEAIKDGLRKMVEKFTGQSDSFSGKPAELGRLTHLLKLVIDRLPSLDAAQRKNIVIELGRVGRMCGDKYLIGVDKAWRSLSGTSSTLGLKGSLHHALANQRAVIFERVMKIQYGNRALGWIAGGDITEKHIDYVRQFGPLCGHPEYATCLTGAAMGDFLTPTLDRAARILGSTNFLLNFYREYDVNAVIQTTRELLSTDEKLQTEADTWIMRNNGEIDLDAPKDNRKYFLENGQLTDYSIERLLIGMEILKEH